MTPRLEEFQTQVARPPDFDAFWDGILEQAARIPLNVGLEPLPLR
jgi:cephalosporin-C deacetylase-like acetyl esterase